MCICICIYTYTKVIIAKHLTSDNKINKIFMTKPDDDLQKILFGEVKK
jgi:hypothetical protein